MKHHYRKQSCKPTLDIERFVGDPTPLIEALSKNEVKSTLWKIANNKACGGDGIAVQIMKYAPDSVKQDSSSTINKNRTLKQHQDKLNIEKLILIPITHPKKPVGAVKNLYNTVRKVAIKNFFNLY